MSTKTKKKKAKAKTYLGVNGEPIFTAKQIEEVDRDHGGYGPVRRVLLVMLTKSVDEVAQQAIKDPEMREALLSFAESSNEYFQWLHEDKGMLNRGQARLFGALEICRKKICPADTP